MKRRLLVCFATLSLLMVVVGGAVSPAAAAPGGNAANAKACQKGGWESLARFEEPGTAFVNQGECISYGAHGGTLVPYAPPVISVVMVQALEGVCFPQIAATGFPPNTTYTAEAYFNGQLVEQPVIPIGANGNWSGSSIISPNDSSATFQFVMGGVSSPVVVYSC